MINIPPSENKRVVIIGCGFGGLRLARELRHSGFQVVIIDRYNYHQFQPLFYQVATAGLEPSAISFPLRKIFHHYKDYFIRVAKVKKLEPDKQQIWTTSGILSYDYLVLAQGACSYYFGMQKMESNAKPMKSVPDALDLRNSLLQNFEDALSYKTDEEREKFMNLVVVGGGPTGVETSGALAEMRKYVLPKDFPELDKNKMKIYLIEASGRLVGSLSEKSSVKAKEFLTKLGVNVILNTAVKEFHNDRLQLSDGTSIHTNLVLWSAGITGNIIPGLRSSSIGPSDRLKVDRFCMVDGYSNIFAIGDLAYMQEGKFRDGHPQVAPVAIQQATLVAGNLKRMKEEKTLVPFSYRDKGTMATVGRNLAIVELPNAKIYGIFAWFIWMFVHLMSIVGTKNRLLIFFNWFWNYVTYDLSLRLIIRTRQPEKEDTI
jgi:NADH:ubiquinone reductase (H+-translocating)